MKSRYAHSKYQAMNAYITTTETLTKPGYIFEPKLDGVRALCFYEKGEITLMSRNDLDITNRYFSDLKTTGAIHAKSCVLDGEIIAFDKEGRPDFLALKNGAGAEYVIFDILMKDGKSLMDMPLMERKKILDQTLFPEGIFKKIVYTPDGKWLWNEVIKMDLEGVMAKERDGLYYPGKRSNVWLKIKIHNTVDCIIIGYKAEKRGISALALALYDDQGKLVHIGNVGTGFSEATIEKLLKVLEPLSTDKPQVEEQLKGMHWVKPKLVAEIKYQELTPYQKLRIPVFIRLRNDKKAADCTMAQQLTIVK